MQPKTDFLQARRSRGFTLIELVIVLIIIGVLAAVAAPRFIDFTDEADEASVRSQAANITAANTINVGACRLDKNDCEEIDGACSNANASQVLASNLDTNVFSVSETAAPGSQWETNTCTLASDNDSTVTADFQLTRTSN